MVGSTVFVQVSWCYTVGARFEDYHCQNPHFFIQVVWSYHFDCWNILYICFFLTMTIACSPGAQNVETGFVSDRPSWNMQWWKQAMAEILITFKIRTVLNNYVHQVAVLIGLQEPSQWLHSSWVMTWSYTVCTTWIQSVLKIHLPRTHRSVNWSRTPRKSPFRRRGKWVENGGCLEGQVR